MASKLVNTDLDFGNGARITNLLNGVADQDAATVAQVKAAIEGIAWKESVRVSTQGNINLAAPGASVDSITMAVNDRFVVRAQTAGAENGIYIWNGAAVAATRSLDANTFDELEQATTTVEEGTSAGATFRQTTVNGTIGVTAVAWTLFGSSTPSASETTAGIAEIATQAETDAGVDDARFITPAKLAGYSGRAKRYAATFGNGSATSYTITHNLATGDVVTVVKETAGQRRTVDCEVQHTTTNSITLVFAVAPALNALRVVVTA